MNYLHRVRYIAAVVLLTAVPVAHGQFNYAVYEGNWDFLPDFTALSPVDSGSSDVIALGVTNLTDSFGLVFTSQINVTSAGTYQFRTTSDDGSRLYIDNTLVVDNDGVHAIVTVEGGIFLNPGSYALRVEFFERAGGEVLEVAYSAAGDAFGPIPSSGNLNEVQTARMGQWSPVIPWPHIAISAANLPDGRVLTWSSTETNAFPANREFTHAAVFDPVTQTFVTTDNNFHDMFCAGVATLEDGRIFASGGNPDDRRTSTFDPTGLSWSPLPEMFDLRWYATSVTLPNNQVFATFGKSAGNRSETFDPEQYLWERTPNASMQILLDEHNAFGNLEWFGQLAVQPNGRVFHGGPTPTLHSFDPMNGSPNQTFGQPTGSRARKWANIVTYDVGKSLLVGGADLGQAPRTLASNVFLVDLSGATPQITQGPAMTYPRALSNTVTLPNGEVLVIGGNDTGDNFSDTGAVMPAEIYDPIANAWRVVDSISIPRTYHSTALLMKDGRVLSAGGGACGNCAVNHLDGQIFSPPYLFNEDGTTAMRPTLSDVPSASGAGNQITVTASVQTQRFTMVRLSATTHHVNTDQRFLPVASSDNGDGTFTLTFNANPNVIIAGNYWLYAVDANGTPSVGETIRILREAVDSDGDGVPDTLDAFPNDPNETMDSDGDGIGDNADPFPNDPSLPVQDSDGDGVANYVDLYPDDPTRSGGIWREMYTGIAGNAVADLLGAADYPNNPAVEEQMALFEGPIDVADAYGTRMRGIFYAPQSGSYTFWVSSDDESVLNLSSNAQPANKETIAFVPVWTSPREWNKFPEQQSAAIDLEEGRPYYLEVLQKEGAGGDNVAVAWQRPDDGTITVIDASVFDPALGVDSDGDGVPDSLDAFPNDPNETTDSDGDGVGDNGDAFPNDPNETQDSDSDGVGDNADAFPNDPNETLDSDGDGVGDNADPTPFGNVLMDESFEAATSWELNPAGTDTATTGLWEAADAEVTQLDGTTYQLDAAADGARYLVTNGTAGPDLGTNDVDGGVTSMRSPQIALPGAVTSELNFRYYLAHYDNSDTDDFLRVSVVGDSSQVVLDERGSADFDSAAWESVTAELSAFAGQTIYLLVEAADAGTPSLIEAGIDNVTIIAPDPLDSDGDGVPDQDDAFPFDPNETVDTDGDGVGDNGDAFPNDPAESADTDGDGVGDNADVFPTDPTETIDTDGDGVGDNGDAFPNDPAETADTDGDGVGDNADAFPSDPTETVDTDGDGVGDNADAFPNDPTETADSDGDGFGDNIDSTPTGGSNIVALPSAPRNSTTLIVETSTGADRIWNVNPDNDSVSVADADGVLLAEIAVGQKPWSLARAPGANRIYVTNKADATISIISSTTLTVEDTVPLPYGSQPHGLVFDATGTTYTVVLEARASVQKHDALSHQLLGEIALGGAPRHATMTHDDATLLISNFVTPPVPGEDTASVDIASAAAQVFSIDPATMTLTDTLTLTHDDRPTSESQGPGLPNYLNAAVVSFDNSQAFVPSKKDNILGGELRGNFGITFDHTVRANTSLLDLATGLEGNLRIDFDNASLATGAAVTGGDRYLLVALETSRELAVYDLLNGFEVLRLITGRAPQGVALSTDGRIAYVHNFMDRSVSRFDLTAMIETELPASNPLPTVNVVSSETLSAPVLLGKQIFYDARDDRLARDNYMSCASCHNDGGQDGRVWDFTSLGEGLRNTIELNGRGGMGHGFLHWSANFDEVQDFEGQIRTLAAGTGLMNDADFDAGTRSEPLGDAKAGLSAELDALAAYLASLGDVDRSPYRADDGTLTTAAAAGKLVFATNGCGTCHAGTSFSGSGDGNALANVGTLTAASGQRLAGPLDGIDIPTLRDVWKTAPYLHDGSAPTLAEAVSAHATIDGDLLGDLVAYLRQIGQEEDEALADSDGDGVSDSADNCLLIANAPQRDTNQDGFGNACDADLNGDLQINITDLGLLRASFFAVPPDPTWNADADFNGDGVVSIIDLGIMRNSFFGTPGPSALVPS
ncbi:MAG: PA14 domain-containing protein, partial [Gammaproteobacteria bacterium]